MSVADITLGSRSPQECRSSRQADRTPGRRELRLEENGSPPTVAGTIPGEALEDGSGPWSLEVLALDRGLYEYFISGTGHDLFSVPPVENVEGGHGVLGSWSRPNGQ